MARGRDSGWGVVKLVPSKGRKFVSNDALADMAISQPMGVQHFSASTLLASPEGAEFEKLLKSTMHALPTPDSQSRTASPHSSPVAIPPRASPSSPVSNASADLEQLVASTSPTSVHPSGTVRASSCPSGLSSVSSHAGTSVNETGKQALCSLQQLHAMTSRGEESLSLVSSTRTGGSGAMLADCLKDDEASIPVRGSGKEDMGISGPVAHLTFGAGLAPDWRSESKHFFDDDVRRILEVLVIVAVAIGALSFGRIAALVSTGGMAGLALYLQRRFPMTYRQQSLLSVISASAQPVLQTVGFSVARTTQNGTNESHSANEGSSSGPASAGSEGFLKESGILRGLPASIPEEDDGEGKEDEKMVSAHIEVQTQHEDDGKKERRHMQLALNSGNLDGASTFSLEVHGSTLMVERKSFHSGPLPCRAPAAADVRGSSLLVAEDIGPSYLPALEITDLHPLSATTSGESMDWILEQGDSPDLDDVFMEVVAEAGSSDPKVVRSGPLPSRLARHLSDGTLEMKTRKQKYRLSRWRSGALPSGEPSPLSAEVSPTVPSPRVATLSTRVPKMSNIFGGKKAPGSGKLKAEKGRGLLSQPSGVPIAALAMSQSAPLQPLMHTISLSPSSVVQEVAVASVDSGNLLSPPKKNLGEIHVFPRGSRGDSGELTHLSEMSAVSSGRSRRQREQEQPQAGSSAILCFVLLLVLFCLFLGRVPAIIATSFVGLLASQLTRSMQLAEGSSSGKETNLSGNGHQGKTSGKLGQQQHLPERQKSGGSPRSPTVADILQHSHASDPRTQAILEGLLNRTGRGSVRG